jgi:quinohemoprotein amine dehydrogenase
MVIEAGASEDEFTTRSSYVSPATGTVVTREGSSIVYTGHQWRGRGLVGGDEEQALREVMLVERDWQAMSGRWFTGAYDELGPDVTLRRVGTGPMVTGVYPAAVQVGGTSAVRLYGANLPPQVDPSELDFGPGIQVSRVTSTADGVIEAVLDVDASAAEGTRDLFLGAASLPEAVVVYRDVDRIEVRPEWGMARVGGANLPKAHQQFEVVAMSDGPDGEPDTADDLELGLVDATWRIEEYTATFGDDDVRFVGAIGQDGLFTPALDGPNPDRSGSRNNIGDVWVVASFTPPGSSRTLQARAHLLVTVPLYIRWAPWGEIP